ncbi:hypothetical protein ACQJBY_032710 [Aegilops geniculata]
MGREFGIRRPRRVVCHDAASASHYLQDHGPMASASLTTAMPTPPGTCTGLRLCDTSRSSKRVSICTSVIIQGVLLLCFRLLLLL